MIIYMFKFVCVTDRKLCREEYCEKIRKIVKGESEYPKPDMLILREKDLSEEEYYNVAKKVQEICEGTGVELVIHTHVNVASNLGIKSIHIPLGQFMLLTDEQKSGFKNIGTSIHSGGDLFLADRLGATYVLAGHIFETNCKLGLPGRGLMFLKEICDNSKIPVYAIGGINNDRIPDIKECGAGGAAIMSGYMK